MSLYDASGVLLAANQDGGCALVATDPVTSSCWDAYLSVSLPAGTYRVVLTQSVNLPAGPTLADGFIYNPANLFNNSDVANGASIPPFGGQVNFTQPPGSSSGGFWDFFPNQRTSAYALDISGATSAIAPVNGPSSTLPFGLLNVTYSPVSLSVQGLVQSGAAASFSWMPPDSGLPPGLSLSPAGVLSGTPTAAGTYTFTATATDGVQPVAQTATVVIYGSLSISTTALPSGQAGQTYGPVQLAVTGGSGSVTWTASGLSALSLSSSGLLSGISPSSGFSFSVTATDTVTGQTVTTTLTVNVPILPLTVSLSTIAEVVAGTPVSSLVNVTGGTPPYTFTSANVPPGLSLGGSGTLTGTAGTPGNFPFTVNVADFGHQGASVSATLSVLGFTSGGLPPASTAAPYSFGFTAAGGSGQYTFTAVGLPAGLTLSRSGALSGTPTSAGSPQFTVQVTDGTVTASVSVTLSVTGSVIPVSVPGGSLLNGQVQVSYSTALSATGGTAPYTWSVTGGALPPGLSLSATGEISGTPTLAGSYSFTAQAKDSPGVVGSGSFTLVITPAPLVLVTGNSLPTGLVGNDYPLQILTATGGVQPYTFSLSSGSLPAGLSLSSGQIGGIPTAQGAFPFTVAVKDAAGATASAALSIQINPAQADLILSDTYLTFSLMTGASALPSGDNVTVRSGVVLQLLNYSFTFSPAVPWLTVSGGSTTPGTLAVNLTAAALSQALSSTPYATTLAVTCIAPSPCAGHTQNVSISLLVTAPPPQLTLTNALLAFNSTTANPASASLPLGIQNTGGGAIGISSIVGADPWVTISGAPASVASGPAVSATVSVNPAGLPAGYNSSSVTVNSSAGSVTIPVTLNISANTTMTLSPAAAQFSMSSGSTLSPASGSFQVSANGSQPITWSAAVLSGATFLSSSTTSGSSSSASAGQVGYSIDPTIAATLSAGTYYGTIRVTSPSVTDSPQDFQIALQVASAATPPVPVPSPAGLLFQTGATTSQPVSVYASSAANVPYQVSASTSDGANWLSVSPATGAASAGSPAASTVSVATAGLAPGVYTGLVNYAFSAAAVRSVNVTLIVTGPGGSAVTGGALAKIALAAACAPAQLVTTQLALPANFSVAAALPVPLKSVVTDNCGNLIPNAQVVVSFSNGDPPFTLNALDTVSGIYTGTWVPIAQSPQVTVSTFVTAPGLASGTSKLNGQVSLRAGPILNSNAVLGVYNPLIGGAIAPGDILQIYGTGLAASAVTSSQVPLSSALGGTSVSIGGLPAPLYYVSPTQVNVQAPVELTPGNQYQVVVNSGGALTAPATVSVKAVQPGIAGYQNGQVIAQHLDGTLVSEASPAKPGTYVVLYLAGLGLTDTPVGDGAASPASPLAHPVNQPTLTLNGVSQAYQFVGLTPGIVGLYQINFLVPDNTTNGDLELIVAQSGTQSNSVILPVHQ